VLFGAGGRKGQMSVWSYLNTQTFYHNSNGERKKKEKKTCFPYISRLAIAAQITLKYLDVTAQVS